MIVGDLKNVPETTLEIVNRILKPYSVSIDRNSDPLEIPKMPPRILNMRKAAAYFGISYQQMIKLVRSGKIKAHKTTQNVNVYLDSAAEFLCGKDWKEFK